jgi:hypothetical protein
LLRRPWLDPRTQIGMKLLARLWHNEPLYFWSNGGVIENRRFKTALFTDVLARAGEIGCQNGKTIGIPQPHIWTSIRGCASAGS